MLTGLLEEYPLRFIDMAEKDGWIWFSACNFNGLFRGSVAEKRVEYMGLFPAAGARDVLLHSTAAIFKNILFFGPRLSENIIAYDIKNGEFECYKVPGLDNIAITYGAFAVQHGQFLIIWNSFNADVVRFDMETRKFDTVQQCRDVSSGGCADSHKSVKGLWRSFCIVEDDIYIASIQTGAVLKVNVNKKEKRLYLLDEVKSVNAICFGRDHFWFTDDKNHLIEWYPDKEMIIYKIDDNIPIRKACLGQFLDGIIYYVLAGVEEDPVVAFHLDGRYFEYMYQESKERICCGKEGLSAGSAMLKVLKDKIWLFSNKYSLLQYIENKKIENCKLSLTDNVDQFIYDRISTYYTDYIYIKEDALIDLEKHLHYILKKQDVVSQEGSSHIQVGKQIYHKI